MVMVSYLVYYDTLLQNATDIITKCDKCFLQNTPSFVLQNATVITKYLDFITKCGTSSDMSAHCQTSVIKKCHDTYLTWF